MRIEIHHIPSQGTTLQYRKPAKDFGALKALVDKGDCDFGAPIEITLEVGPEKDFYRVKGKLTTTLRMACARCLADFDASLAQRFKLNYSRKIPEDLHAPDGQGVELTAQQVGMYYFEGDAIDFTDAVQEQAILAIPYRPLCHEACKGLCPQCGADWNQAACQCGNQAADSPFAVLKGLNLKG